ncbi:MAG: S-methyl-5-thioribose-1-phosphate isomerase [Proteobacteria bacterium]|nr:S-methyl-5-thioribose-1-phosphate isomerase [Pseudomonadota bacterium]
MPGSVPPALKWEQDQLFLLDQRALPVRIEYLHISTIAQARDAIHTLTVRGAPAIGIAAAYALVVAMKEAPLQRDGFLAHLNQQAKFLHSARPTAVNLGWAIDRLQRAAAVTPTWQTLRDEAVLIHSEDLAMCEAIGRNGAHLITNGCNILTHCNAGALAVSALGTATAPMYVAHQAGVRFHVYADETRPLLQGARLTAWELDQAGIDVTLICDNVAATLMAAGSIDLVLVGTDRVAANGDVVNKIGTLNLAVLCRHFKVPFYVACPSSTYDPHTPSGEEVPIEERSADEVRSAQTANVAVFNPAFDVTPHALVSGIITDRGIARAPLPRTLPDLLAN